MSLRIIEIHLSIRGVIFCVHRTGLITNRRQEKKLRDFLHDINVKLWKRGCMCSYVEWQKRPSSCTVNINLTMIIVSTESSAIVATVFLWTCSQCMAAVHTAQTNFTTGRRVATSYMTLQSYSKIQCLKKCFDEKRHNRCSMAGYDLATRTCFLSNDAEQDLLDADENVGVFFYSDPAGMGTLYIMTLFINHIVWLSRSVFQFYRSRRGIENLGIFLKGEHCF